MAISVVDEASYQFKNDSETVVRGEIGHNVVTGGSVPLISSAAPSRTGDLPDNGNPNGVKTSSAARIDAPINRIGALIGNGKPNEGRTSSAARICAAIDRSGALTVRMGARIAPS